MNPIPRTTSPDTAENAANLTDMADVTQSSGAGDFVVPSVGADVIDSQGTYASVIGLRPAVPHVASTAWGNPVHQVVLMAAGHQVALPCSLLQRETAHVFRVPFTFASLLEQPPRDESVHLIAAEPHVIPVIQEEMQIGTRLVDTGRGMRIHKTVAETPHVIEQPLMQDDFTVEHVLHDQVIENAEIPKARYEGQTLVIPVMEEVLVVQKQLRMKEEIRITRVQRQVSTTQTVILKSEQVQVERFDDRSGGKS